ncbi:MAG: hypothetical protein E7480_06665 [Ruminococcaceae bacterium]|nr:hypothetical protein [Oscillospiraceae bacterium]
MSVALDIITLVLVLGLVILGIFKGLVKSLIGLLSGVIALVIAFVVSIPFGNYIGDNLINPAITSVFTKQIEQSANSEIESNQNAEGSETDNNIDLDNIDIEEALKNAPEAIKNILQTFKVNPEEIIESIKEDSADTVEEYKASVLDAIITPVSRGVGRIIAFVILFILSSIAIYLISIPLKLVSKLPIINKFNKLGGGILGLLQATIIIFVISYLVTFVSPILSIDDGVFTPTTVEETVVFKHFHNINPIN